jgi:hypothetical protein
MGMTGTTGTMGMAGTAGTTGTTGTMGMTAMTAKLDSLVPETELARRIPTVQFQCWCPCASRRAIISGSTAMRSTPWL